LPAELKTQVIDFWVNSPLPMIVDASALDWLPHGFTRSQALRLITPHPGEAARMLSVNIATVQKDRPGALRALSRGYGSCWVVLKGRHTLVGNLNGKIGVNSSGNPMLAQGGSGDVLAGFLGGLLAQAGLLKHADKTIRFGVWAHGAASDRLDASDSRWTIEDLASHLRPSSLKSSVCSDQ
jgi:NAD(P)H-hydrate epimerase